MIKPASKPKPATSLKPRAGKRSTDQGRETVASNRKAFHEYFVMDRYECGLKLTGPEVKVLREGHCTISDAYAMVDKEKDVAWLMHLQIPAWQYASAIDQHEPKRKRQLLLHKKEIRKLREEMQEQGLTLIPLEIYFRNGFAKVEIAVCKGKKLHDKRDAIKERDAKVRIARRVVR